MVYHAYLWKKGISTWVYIQAQREGQKAEKEAADTASESGQSVSRRDSVAANRKAMSESIDKRMSFKGPNSTLYKVAGD